MTKRRKKGDCPRICCLLQLFSGICDSAFYFYFFFLLCFWYRFDIDLDTIYVLPYEPNATLRPGRVHGENMQPAPPSRGTWQTERRVWLTTSWLYKMTLPVVLLLDAHYCSWIQLHFETYLDSELLGSTFLLSWERESITTRNLSFPVLSEETRKVESEAAGGRLCWLFRIAVWFLGVK